MSSLLSIALVLAAADSQPPVVALAVAPDGAHVVAGSQGGIEVRMLPELKRVRSLATKLEHVHDLKFSPRGDVLAAAGGSPGERGAVELWEWPAAKLKTTLAAGDDVAYDVAWNAEGTELAIACGDRTVRVVAVGTGSKGRLGARKGSDGTPTHSLGAPVPSTLRAHSAAVLAAAWLPADELIVSAGVDQSIRVLKGADGKTVRSLDNHTAAVRDLAVRPGAHGGPAVVASAGSDRTVRFWQPSIGRLVRFARLPVSPTAICWTESGTHVLAAGEDGRLRAIEYETLAMRELPEHLDGWAHAVAALPGGEAAVLGGQRGELRIVPLHGINP